MITISVIYKSADTAETINRAIDNSMGTTTTSQGATSNGLIIKEDLKPIIQNVQTYLNPFVDKTIFGTPPLTFHSVQAVIDWSIWGNADTGTYVGERTINLFSSVWETGSINATTGQNNNSGALIRTKDYIPIVPNTLYSFSRDLSTGYMGVRLYKSDKSYIGPGSNSTVRLISGNTVENPMGNNTPFCCFEIIDSEASFIRFNDSTNNLNTKWLMVEGEYTQQTIPDYEPYGVNIPIKFNGTTYNTYISDYLRKSDGDTPVYDVMMSDGTIIRAVNSDGTAKETPTTETYTAPILTAIWGYNTFDVDTTVTPANVIINYQDN